MLAFCYEESIMISSSAIAKSVRAVLRDNFAASGFAYADAEVVEFINRAIHYCGAIATDMTVKTQDLSLVAGKIQRLPNESTRLVAVLGNALEASFTEQIGVRSYDGQAPVQAVPLNFMQSLQRNYTGQPKKRIVTMVSTYPDTPHVFTVFPPNDGTGKLTVSYRDELPTITSIANNDIHLANFYEGAIGSFALYCALTRDGEDNPLADDGKRYLEICNSQLQSLTSTVQAQQGGK